MARRKSPAEVGPLGVWAYDTRDALDLSVEAAVAALPTQYHPATLRKVEGGSARPGTRMWRELGNLYVRLAEAKGVAIDPQPKLVPDAPGATETPDSVLEVVRVLLAEIQAERAERRAWEQGFLEAMRELAKAAARQDDHEPEPRVGARR